MKRETALKYSQEIARRVHSVNGILATPLCSFSAVRIKRVWVFGSTAKGKANPNYLDVLIDWEDCGEGRSWRQGKLDKRYLKSYGIRVAIESGDELYKWLTKGMKMVTKHDYRYEDTDFKKMIYPKYEMDLV